MPEEVVTRVTLVFRWGEEGCFERIVKHFRTQAEADQWLAEKCKDKRYLPLAGTV
jgi:hypothetical protein